MLESFTRSQAGLLRLDRLAWPPSAEKMALTKICAGSGLAVTGSVPNPLETIRSLTVSPQPSRPSNPGREMRFTYCLTSTTGPDTSMVFLESLGS